MSEPTGLLVYSLGEHFTEFLRWPVLGGVPTWLMAVASAAAWTVLGRTLWVGRRRLAKPVRRGSGGTMALLGAAWGLRRDVADAAAGSDPLIMP